ncbi:MAG TPA: Ig domain-containing protein [Longimicrobium sp.]|nr:Ig domain-containing protein [Longimicrobium sp.]
MSRGARAVGVVLLVGVACVFQPDLSRFPACDEQGACPAGSTCLAEQGICLPDCGDRGPCISPDLDGGDATDGGPTDAGMTDAGTTDGGTDAGMTDAGMTDAGTPDGGTPDGGPGPVVLAAEGPGPLVETVSFSHRFQASGGTPPYTFSSVDALPPGLELGRQGTLSGRPTVAGDHAFTLEVVDQGTPPLSARRPFSVTVLPLLRLAGPAILADFPSGRAYVEQVSATGGTPPYRFELVAGSTLPAGLVLQENGQIEGTPSGGGAATFEVRVTDSGAPPQVATRTLQLTSSTCSLLCVRTRSVPDARAGTGYSYALQASGGTGALTWKVESGSLPPGVGLAADTGVLSGTPTQAGTYELTVSVADVLPDNKKFAELSLKVF